MPTPEQVRAAVDAYVGAINKDDRDAWLAVFAPGAVQEDPVGTPVNVGHEAIGRFWDNFHVNAERVELHPTNMVVCGAEAAVPLTLVAYTGGFAVEMDCVDVFTVGDDGLITGMRGFVDPSQVRMADQ
jgi:steroid delta-isomerase